MGILTTNRKSPVIFTAGDIEHLAARFTILQLRHELHRANVHRAKALLFCQEDLMGYYDEYIEAVNLAIELRKWCKQREKPTGSPTPRIKVEDIKNNIDIVTFIEQYTRLRKSGRNFLGCCPIHDDRHPSLTVYPEDQRWWCFGCNRGGDVFDFIMAVENIDFKQAATLLVSR